MKKKYENGDVYEGQGSLFTKKRNGNGKMTYANGDVYEGEWKDDKRCGHGTMTYKYLGSYVGYWENDKFHGKGQRVFRNGDSMSGTFVNGALHGTGKTVKASRTHEGSYVNGEANGTGVETGFDSERKSNYTYKGNFEKGLFNGSGKIEYLNGDWYSGTFKAGKPWGRGSGRLKTPNGVYEGATVGGVPCGNGVLTGADGILYSGKFKDGELDGEVKITYPDKTTEVKIYKNGKEAPNEAEAAERENAVKEEKKDTPKTRKNTAEKSKAAGKSAPKKVAEKKEKAINFDRMSKKIIEEAEQIKKQAQAAQEVAEAFINDEKSPERVASRARFYEEEAISVVKEFEEMSNREKQPGGALAQGCYIHKEEKDVTDGSTWVKKGRFVYSGDGYGSYEVDGGATYAEGEWKNNTLHGVGVMKKDGLTVIGEWDNGETKGYFLASNPSDGLVCYGKCLGKTNVIGTIRNTNDKTVLYEGEIRDFLPQGTGVYRIADREMMFRFDKGTPKGSGKCKSAEEEFVGKYEFDGNSVGVITGDGYVVYGTADNYFDITGVGVGEYENGTYWGGFKETRRHGYGVYKYADGEVYEGEFCEGTRSGKCRIRLANGETYEGDICDGELAGKGVYKYENGDVYEGEWKDGYRHGKGKYTFADGSVYEGGWKKEIKHGKGVYTYADGQVLRGKWQDGDFCE